VWGKEGKGAEFLGGRFGEVLKESHWPVKADLGKSTWQGWGKGGNCLRLGRTSTVGEFAHGKIGAEKV